VIDPLIIWLITAPLWLPLLLLVAYAVGIQYERAGMGQGWGWHAAWLVAGPAWVADIILAHSLFAAYLRYWPQRGEWTFSQVLARLIERDGLTGEIARYLKRVLDAIAPTGIHVKPRG
jgi:hypothetical protein